MASIRLIQIGAGIRGQHWAQFIRNYPDAQCVALVEPMAAARDKALALLGDAGCKGFADLDEALRGVQADAALIVTPSVTHADVTIRCLDAGLTVMVEKPLATTIDEARRVLLHARKVGRQVIVAENYRFWPAERTIQRLLGEQFLGRLDNAIMVDRRRQPSGSEGPWFGTIQYPQLQEIATHHFDSLRAFFGAQPLNLALRCWNPPWTDYAHGANTEALIDFGHMHVQYLATLLSQRYEFSLRIEGDKGVLWSNRKYLAFRKAGSRWFMPMKCDKVPKGDERPYPQGGTTSLLDSLRDAVQKGTRAATTGEDNIWTIAMVDAGKLSDQQRRTVDLTEVYTGLGAT
jgi:predicted dehydrogenase